MTPPAVGDRVPLGAAEHVAQALPELVILQQAKLSSQDVLAESYLLSIVLHEPCLVAVDDEIERGVERGEEVREGDHGVRPRRRPHRRHVLTCGT